MRIARVAVLSAAAFMLIGGASTAAAQTPAAGGESPWFVDLGFGIAPSINGNINSGAIGTLQGQTTAVLPQSYGDVYGTGLDIRFGGGYTLNEDSEIRGIFTYQTADADLVRLGDFGASSLYSQYSDYKSLALDFGYRRYLPVSDTVRGFGEATIGIGFISRINAQFAAPQSNIIFTNTDFYDTTEAFTFGINIGAIFRVSDRVDATAQVGLRRVGPLAEVDDLVGTGLAEINDNSSRLTFPIVVGVRFRFK
jgi:hypothetical protein